MSSKYSSKPEVTDLMVSNTIAWIEQSLVEYIPVMTTYPAFSAKLLQVAFALPKAAAWRRIKDENVMRVMECLADPVVADMPAVLMDTDFIRHLLDHAINGTRAISALPSGSEVVAAAGANPDSPIEIDHA
jgi:hypothetical protein